MSCSLPLPRLVRSAAPARSDDFELSEREAKKDELTYYSDPALLELGVTVAFTQRWGGVSRTPYLSLNTGAHVGDDLQDVMENRALILSALDIDVPAVELSVPEQTHSDHIGIVFGDCTSTQFSDTDALITSVPNKPIMLCFADCVPVILVAPPVVTSNAGLSSASKSLHDEVRMTISSPTVGVVHAGWKGALADIPAKAVRRIVKHTGCAPSEINVYIGAHIRECCCEVSQEIIDDFVEAYGATCDSGERHLSLSQAIRSGLDEAGIDQRRIVELDQCTVCNTDQFFSYRAEGGVTGRHSALASIHETAS